MGGYTSTTLDLQVAQTFTATALEVAMFHIRVSKDVFHILDMRDPKYSKFWDSEAEVLFPPYSAFVIYSVELEQQAMVNQQGQAMVNQQGLQIIKKILNIRMYAVDNRAIP